MLLKIKKGLSDEFLTVPFFIWLKSFYLILILNDQA